MLQGHDQAEAVERMSNPPMANRGRQDKGEGRGGASDEGLREVRAIPPMSLEAEGWCQATPDLSKKQEGNAVGVFTRVEGPSWGMQWRYITARSAPGARRRSQQAAQDGDWPKRKRRGCAGSGCACCRGGVLRDLCVDTARRKPQRRRREQSEYSADRFECDDECACGPGCRARRAHNASGGMQRRTNVIYQGPELGYGLYLAGTEKLAQGEFLGEYLGACVLRNKPEQVGSGMYYLNIGADEHKWFLDARKMGNATRMIQHSCLPNLAVRHVITCSNPDTSRPVLQALRDILPGDELTYAYAASADALERFFERCACQVCAGRDGNVVAVNGRAEAHRLAAHVAMHSS